MTEATAVRRSRAELEAAEPSLRAAPADDGPVEMIVARPAEDARRVLKAGTFTLSEGLLGDDWRVRGSGRTDDGGPDPDRQVTLIGRRFLELIAGARDRWPLAGDQLVVDLDLGTANLQPGDRLHLGRSVLEVTPAPHTGCAKFAARFGRAALAFTATQAGREMRLRGLYAKVVTPGAVRVGEGIRVERRRG